MRRAAAVLLAAALVALTAFVAASASSVAEIASDEEFWARVDAGDCINVVEFYAPWCGHCKRFEPVYAEVAARLSDNALLTPCVRVARMNGDARTDVLRHFNVHSFPTIVMFMPGSRDIHATFDVRKREADALVRWVFEQGDVVEAAVQRTPLEDLRGRIQTVTGLIDPAELGWTHTHEHLRIAYRKFFDEPTDPEMKKKAYEPISMSNLHWVQYHWSKSWENMELNDEDLIVDEVSKFKAAGGDAIVELTTIGIRFDHHAESLLRISQRTGVKVILGTGYYMGPSHSDAVRTELSIDEIAQTMIDELTLRVGQTNVRAGVIGEIGCSYPLYDSERRVLIASAIAQRSTGAGLIIHPGRDDRSPFEIIDILKEHGADISRTVISHLDRTVRDYDVLKRLAETGVGLEWDMFGLEISYYPYGPYMPSDYQRMDFIRRIAADGHLHQIVVSHDIFSKHRLTAFGGHGYHHFVANVAPRLKVLGMTDADLHAILVDNPRRFLTFA